MFKKTLTAAALVATVLTGVTPSAAMARHWDDHDGGWGDHDGGWHDHGWRGHGWRGDRGRYYYGGGYGGYDGYYGGRHFYRGRYHHCDRGDGGTVIGAIAGGLLGNSIAGYGDRTAGTIIGAGVGALAGRAIDRDC
jgi:hypothetical protein